MAYVRTRICVDCGKADEVRKDNAAERCVSCSGRRNGAIGLPAVRARRFIKPCGHCGEVFHTTRSNPAQFCSKACYTAAVHIERECETCNRTFVIYKSSISGKTNAAGRFCSQPCYWQHLCRTDRQTGRGSQWRKTQREAIARAPFCALCGTSKRLQVHHIIPFRLTFDNSQENLIPLCQRHHKVVETAFLETEKYGLDMALTAWRSMLLERQFATRAKILELARGIAHRTMAYRASDRLREKPSQE
jgi:hypothetical protein